MSTTKSVTLWCDVDDCMIWREGGQDRTDAQARKAARFEGWTRKNGEDRCPTHSPDGVVSKPPLPLGFKRVTLSELMEGMNEES